MMKCLEEKLQRTTSDLLVQYTEEEELFRKKMMVNNTDVSSAWKCTICMKDSTETPYPHPILKVLVCFDCMETYDSAIFLANKDGTDSNCRWCAKPAKKFTCSRCTVIFCKNCINNNFENDYASRVASKNEWTCFICNSKPIWRLRGVCAVLLENMRMTASQETLEVHNENSDNILSQKVNVNNGETQNQSFSDESEVITPKKQLKPIQTSDDDEEDTQKSDKEFESMIQEYEGKFKIFSDNLSTRIQCIPEKLNTAKSVEEKEKLIDKLDKLCSMALENIQDIQKHIEISRANWKDNMKIHNNCTSTRKPKNSKFNLSLKSTSEHNLQEKQKQDSVTALNQISSLNDSPITPPNSGPISPSTRSSISEEKIEDTPILGKQTARKKTGQTSFRNREENSKPPSQNSGSISPSTSSSISEEKIEDSPILKKQTARKKTGQTSFRNHEDNSKSPEIKKEETDASSAFSRETQKRGDFNLSTRIKEDFGGEQNDNEVAVTIETIRCEKTGEICQSYYKVHQNSAKEDISDDSEKTVNYNWEEMNLETEIKKEEQEIKIEEQEIKIEETETTSNVANQSESESDYHSDQNYDSLSTSSDSYTERDRKRALASLEKDISDVDSSSSITSLSSILQSSVENDVETPEEIQQPLNVGYVTNLNIAAEIAKLKGNYRQDSDSSATESDSSAKESDGDDTSDDNLDPKMYKMEPIVVLDRHYKLKMKPVIVLDKLNIVEKSDENKSRDSNKSSDDSRIDKDSDNDTDEIRRLTNLNSLDRKRHLQTSSDNSSTNSEGKRKKRRKKKIKKSQDIISDSDSGSFISTIKSDPGSDNLLSEEPVQKPTNVGVFDLDDYLKDETEMSEDDSVEVIEETSKEKCEKNKKSTKCQEEDEKSKWRKDKLLTGSLNPGKDSDTDETNDSVANEILQKEEEKYLQNADKEPVKRKRSCSTVEEVEEISSSDDDAIVVSDNNTESNDSDIQFVDVKHGEGSPHKKGRRNINKILDDDELKEETKLADKEESERKERITLIQRSLDQMLSETQLSQEEVGMVLEMDEKTKKPVITIHHSLVKRLKEHQEKGIKFMWSVCFESVSEIQKSKGVGCILAHCMGLGKTMQVVVLVHALLTHKQTNIKHVLIVCPLSTVLNWKNEFTQTLKVCPRQINVSYINPDRQKNFNQKMFEVKRWKNVGGVLLMGYETFQSLVNENKLQKYEETYKKIMLESLIDPGPELVVCDEGHMLKNGNTLRFLSLNRIKTRRRIILTGTPLQNNLIEYYHMVNFVKPHLLGTIEEYKNRFVNPISNGQYEDSNRDDIRLMKSRSHILHKKLENTVQRFEEAELIPYLPEKHDYVLFVQLTDLQIKLYEHYLDLLDAYTIFKNYHALQNIWTHPALLQIKYERRKEPPQKKQKRYDESFVPAILDPDTEDYSLNSNWFKDMLPEDVMSNISYGVKMELLFSIIKECKKEGDKLLVFSSSIAELDLIEHFLENRKDETWKKDTDYYRMDGTVAPEKRMSICNNFNNVHNKRARLFLVSHKVGGLGLNLTAANRVILMDVSWNPAYDIQSVFRVYRFGQTKRCFIYRFVSMGTMEEVVYSRAVTKLAIAGRVVDEHQIKRHFNSDDLQKMYSLQKDFGEPPTPTLPSDHLLARLWENHKPLLFKFSDHKSLLANLTHEELNEEERKIAWEEYKIECHREQQMKDNMMNNRLAAVSSIVNNNIPMVSVASSSYGPSRHTLPPLNLDKKYKRPNPLPSRTDLIRRLNHLDPTDASTSAVPGPSTADPIDLTSRRKDRNQDTNLQIYPNPYSTLKQLFSMTDPSSESQLMDYLLRVQSKLSNNGVDLLSPSIGNNGVNRGPNQIEEPENEP